MRKKGSSWMLIICWPTMPDDINCQIAYENRKAGVAIVAVSQQIPHLPIPCMVYSMNSGGSCVDCMNQNVRNVSNTWNTGMASPHYANVCVRSNGACV